MKIQCKKCPNSWIHEEASTICNMCGWDQNSNKYESYQMATIRLSQLLNEDVQNKKTSINDYSFKELQSMLYKSLVGDLNTSSQDKEDMEGITISFTLKNDVLLFAETEEQLKNFGSNALDAQEFISKQEREENEIVALTQFIQDITAAIKMLDDKQKKEIFDNGKKFVSTEIIFSDTEKNINIPDNKNVILFHGSIEYDGEANKLHKFLDSTIPLSTNMLKLASQEKDGTKNIIFNDADTVNRLKLYKDLSDTLKRLCSEFKLSETDTVSDYKELWWERELDSEEQKNNFTFGEDEYHNLINGLINNVPIDNLEDDKKKWFETYQEQIPRLKKIVDSPFNRILIKANVSSIRRMVETISANNPQKLDELQKELTDSLERINNSSDRLETARIELEKLTDEGINSIIPPEGMIYIKSGRPTILSGSISSTGNISNNPEISTSQSDAGGTQIPSKNNKQILKKVLQMKILNPETNNYIKVDTAMDYNKKHPAHQIALNTIRKHMGNVSSRAGIGKHSKTDK